MGSIIQWAGLATSTGGCGNGYPAATTFAWIFEMRRRLQKFLPVVLLALLVQVLAPIGAAWAAALDAADPLQATAICHSGAAGSGQAPDQGPGSHYAACGVCCMAQAGAALDAPKFIAVATPYRPAVLLVWRDQAAEPARSLVGSNAQARAPPLSM